MKPTIERCVRLLALVPFALAGACEPGGIIEDIQNCIQICDNYQDCQDSRFDRTECANACEDRADYDDPFQEAADRCERCLDSGSCAEQAEFCAEDCDPIINEALREGA